MFHVHHDLLCLERHTDARSSADAAPVSPGVRPPLPQLAFPVDQSRLGASRSTRTETNHDSNLKTERPVPGAEVGTRVSGRRPSPRRRGSTWPPSPRLGSYKGRESAHLSSKPSAEAAVDRSRRAALLATSEMVEGVLDGWKANRVRRRDRRENESMVGLLSTTGTTPSHSPPTPSRRCALPSPRSRCSVRHRPAGH